MPGPRQPIELIVARGAKHLGKEEIAARLASEPRPVTDGIEAPKYLNAKQRAEFDKIAGQLQKIKIMSETDCDTLARYVIAQELYVQAVKDLGTVRRKMPKDIAAEGLVAWAGALEKLDKRQGRYFEQAQSAARDLGLTITSRCKLVVPVKDEEPKANKFARFGGAVGGA